MAGLPRRVRDHLNQARDACLAAVDNYNRPGVAFRTRTFTILMTIAWTSLFHAIFYRQRRKPWYVRSGAGRGIRYEKVDGDPRHWELNECLRQFFRENNPAERENLQFMSAVRNKIEHRHHPELDPVLHGECQALLMNFEALLVSEFGERHALAENLALALQFSAFDPESQQKAIRRLTSSAARDLLEFVQNYRAGLPAELLEDPAFAVRVLLQPRIANRASAADLAVEFETYDENRPKEAEEPKKVTALIKEKTTPVASAGLLKPSIVVQRVRKELPAFSMHMHTQAWRAYGARPPTGSGNPVGTRADFCTYDHLANGYGYTEAWVKFLVHKLRDEAEFDRVRTWNRAVSGSAAAEPRQGRS